MAESQSQEDPTTQVEAASKAFEQEFERFARFTRSIRCRAGAYAGRSGVGAACPGGAAHATSGQEERAGQLQEEHRTDSAGRTRQLLANLFRAGKPKSFGD